MQNTEQYHDHSKNALRENAEQYREYNKYIYLSLVAICIVSLLLAFIPFALVSGDSTGLAGDANPLAAMTSTGLLILIAELIVVMVYDWRGVIRLRGVVKKQTMHKGKFVSTAPGLFLLYLFFPEIILPIYFVYVGRDFHRARANKQQVEINKQLEKRRQIAVMEAHLGILPATEGTCRSCHKPLQVGAEFCSYCGETVIEHPKVCPSCAITTFADAKFCPNCRLPLS